MHDAEIGWIAAIIIGGIAGWLAEMFHEERHWHAHQYRAGHRRCCSGQFPVRNLWRRARWVVRLPHCGLRRSLHSYLCVARN